MTATTHDRTRTRSMLFSVGDTELLPLSLTDLPKPIAAANAAAHAAVEQWRAAQRTAGELSEQAKHAPRHDELTAQAAAAAGEPPPAGTAGPKRAKADDAKRAAEAHELVAKRAVRALYDTVEDHYDGFLEARRRAAEEVTAPLRAAVDTMLAQYAEFITEQALYDCAQKWHNNPSSAALSAGMHAVESNRKRFGKRLEEIRGQIALRPNGALIQNEIPALLAALALQFEELASTGRDD